RPARRAVGYRVVVGAPDARGYPRAFRERDCSRPFNAFRRRETRLRSNHAAVGDDLDARHRDGRDGAHADGNARLVFVEAKLRSCDLSVDGKGQQGADGGEGAAALQAVNPGVVVEAVAGVDVHALATGNKGEAVVEEGVAAAGDRQLEAEIQKPMPELHRRLVVIAEDFEAVDGAERVVGDGFTGERPRWNLVEAQRGMRVESDAALLARLLRFRVVR